MPYYAQTQPFQNWPKSSFTLVTIYSYNISLRKQGVCHTLAFAIYMENIYIYIKAKEEL
jgi:hypothetical protein